MILFGGSSRYFVCDGVCVVQIFCECPACASSADVSVRKCHGTLGECELWEVTGLIYIYMALYYNPNADICHLLDSLVSALAVYATAFRSRLSLVTSSHNKHQFSLTQMCAHPPPIVDDNPPQHIPALVPVFHCNVQSVVKWCGVGNVQNLLHIAT